MGLPGWVRVLAMSGSVERLDGEGRLYQVDCRQVCRAGLAKYEASRNLADASAVSKLSPYIHFGQVHTLPSPFQ